MMRALFFMAVLLSGICSVNTWAFSRKKEPPLAYEAWCKYENRSGSDEGFGAVAATCAESVRKATHACESQRRTIQEYSQYEPKPCRCDDLDDCEEHSCRDIFGGDSSKYLEKRSDFFAEASKACNGSGFLSTADSKELMAPIQQSQSALQHAGPKQENDNPRESSSSLTQSKSMDGALPTKTGRSGKPAHQDAAE